MASKCKYIKADGTPCGAYAVEGSDYCWFHGGGSKQKRGVNASIDMSKAVVEKATSTYNYSESLSLMSGDSTRPRIQKLKEFENFYKEGGIVAQAIDSYVASIVSNGFQLIDSITGERYTSNTKIIDELEQRIEFTSCFEKVALDCLIYGFAWGEMVIEDKKITKLVVLPPAEIDMRRDKSGRPKEYRQIRNGKQIATWSGKTLDNIFYVAINILHDGQKYGIGLMEKIYDDAKSWKKQGDDLGAVTTFVAYPFRVAYVGSDQYPASEASVTNVADIVENLEPGDWLATRHNIKFEFISPEAPEALVSHYKEETSNLIVGMGMPNMYAALDNIDTQTLKEIRNTFNATVRSIQTRIATAWEKQVISKQFDLLGKTKKRSDIVPVSIVWNPLTVSVLSILELTQLVTAGVVSIGEARRILESMGYGLLRGQKSEELEQIGQQPLQAPKEAHPTEDEPDKEPVSKPTEENPPKAKKPTSQPKVQKPQPNAPKLSYDDWLNGIKALGELDKFEAAQLLKNTLINGFIKNTVKKDENI